MCERRHADKMILSQDASCFTDWLAPGVREQMAPNWHYLHVVQDVIPALRERGIDDAAIDQVMRENGRRFFER
jgi:phosphotriesterase-related protein